MKEYWSIDGAGVKPPLGESCLAFYKHDGSNIRSEWHKKRGWWLFGTRRRTFDASDPEYGCAIDIFCNKYADGIEKVLMDKFPKIQEAIAYCEFFGPNSFSGQHDPKHMVIQAEHNDPKDMVLIDLNLYKKGLLDPWSFVKTLGHLPICKVVYEGPFSEEFILDVRQGKYPVFEGVVAKGGKSHKLWMRKVKTYAYLDELKKRWGQDWERRMKKKHNLKAQTQADLNRIYESTNFADMVGDLEWEGIEFEEIPANELGFHIYVPQCAEFGNVLITLDDTYENSGEDCYFIQELMRLYRDGRLKVVE